MIRHNNIAIPLLPDWEDGTQVVAVGPEEDGFRPNLVVSQDPLNAGESIHEFAQRQMLLVEQLVDQYQLITQGAATHGPHHGFLREYQFETNGVILHQMQFHIPVGEEVYTFTCTNAADRFETTRSLMLTLFAGIRIYADENESDESEEESL